MFKVNIKMYCGNNNFYLSLASLFQVTTFNGL